MKDGTRGISLQKYIARSYEYKIWISPFDYKGISEKSLNALIEAFQVICFWIKPLVAVFYLMHSTASDQPDL